MQHSRNRPSAITSNENESSNQPGCSAVAGLAVRQLDNIYQVSVLSSALEADPVKKRTFTIDSNAHRVALARIAQCISQVALKKEKLERRRFRFIDLFDLINLAKISENIKRDYISSSTPRDTEGYWGSGWRAYMGQDTKAY